MGLLDNVSLEALRGKKNLLAFSGGVDSTALFFLLMESGVEFDIAIVNYNTRESSKAEEEYAKELANLYSKRCFALSVNSPKKNFEAEARRIRYEFFEKIIKEHNYHNLITAHQLNDRLEWFLMRLSSGAGLSELIGPGAISQKSSYTVVRPLLRASRDEIYDFLKERNIKYFEDSSNADSKYKRNHFRAEFALPFMRAYKDGVLRSFEILEGEASLFKTRFFEKGALIAFMSKTKEIDSVNISLALKKLGYLLSRAQREEIIKNYDAVVGGAFAVSKNKKGIIFVSPYLPSAKMDKNFRELCRILDIPSKQRSYLAASGADVVRQLAREMEQFFALRA